MDFATDVINYEIAFAIIAGCSIGIIRIIKQAIMDHRKHAYREIDETALYGNTAHRMKH